MNLPIQRIGIKDRVDVVDCVCEDNNLGSTGVTVLGIALVSIKRLGNDFIDVVFNGTVISLFNSHKHSVMDVMLQAGINPKVLISKNGKNIRFNLNGNTRLAFGTLSKGSVVKVNNKLASIDTELSEGDKIEVEYSRNGESATPKVIEFIPDFNPVSFYLNNEIINLEPIFMINDKIVNLDETIHEGDDVKIILPRTFQDFKQYFKQYEVLLSYTLAATEVKDNYIIKELDRIKAFSKETVVDTITEPKIIKVKEEKVIEKSDKITNVYVNDKRIELKGKDKYVFIDLFDYINFDLSKPQGMLVLLLNDNKAGYHDVLSEGNRIVIRWE